MGPPPFCGQQAGSLKSYNANVPHLPQSSSQSMMSLKIEVYSQKCLLDFSAMLYSHLSITRRGGNRTWRRATFCALPAAEVVVFARDCEPPGWIKHAILAVFRNFRWQARGKWSLLSLCMCGKRGHFLVNRHERTAKRTSDLRFSLVAHVRDLGACARHLDRIY